MPSNDDRLRQLIETCKLVMQVMPQKQIDQGSINIFNSTCTTVDELSYNIFQKKLGWSDKRLGVLATLESQVANYSTAILNAPAIVVVQPPVVRPIAARVVTPLKAVSVTQAQIDARRKEIAAKLAPLPTPATTTTPAASGEMYEYKGAEEDITETPTQAEEPIQEETQKPVITALVKKAPVSLEKIPPSESLITKYKVPIFIASVGSLLYAMYRFLNKPEPKLSDIEDDE